MLEVVREVELASKSIASSTRVESIREEAVEKEKVLAQLFPRSARPKVDHGVGDVRFLVGAEAVKRTLDPDREMTARRKEEGR